jgi:uncharacterized protein
MSIGKKSLLAIVCILAGAIPLDYGFISNDLARFTYTVVVAVAYLAFTLMARKKSSLRRFWELSFAFFVLALVGVLNNLSHYFGTYILNSPPVSGDPLASTVTASVIVQLVETLVAIVPIIVLTKAAGMPLSSIYARKGRLRGLFFATIVVFVFLFIVTGIHQFGFITSKGSVTLSKYLSLAPALLIMVISNGFQEEFLFRGLFLQKYNAFFSGPVSIFLSAIVFGIAHLGVTYSASSIIFILIAVFPLGLITAFLMRRTNGVVTPAILHAGFDILIYWAFLSYVI